MTSKVRSSIAINTKTWSRDSHKLFDYECLVVSNQQYMTEKTCNILRIGNEVDFLETNQEICYQQSESRVIAKIEQNCEGFKVKRGQEEELWLVVKTVVSGYELKVDDIIKLGRVKLRVKRIKTIANQHSVFEEPLLECAGICRICFQDDTSNENPLISPCKCSGSMKSIHLSCLQLWINSKLVSNPVEKPTHFH